MGGGIICQLAPHAGVGWVLEAKPDIKRNVTWCGFERCVATRVESKSVYTLIITKSHHEAFDEAVLHSNDRKMEHLRIGSDVFFSSKRNEADLMPPLTRIPLCEEQLH